MLYADVCILYLGSYDIYIYILGVHEGFVV